MVRRADPVRDGLAIDIVKQIEYNISNATEIFRYLEKIIAVADTGKG